MTRRVFASFTRNRGWLVNVFLVTFLSVILLTGSWYIYGYVLDSTQKQRQSNLERAADSHIEKISNDIDLVINYLYDFRGTLVSGGINEKNWSSFIGNSDVENRYPNYLSLAFVEKVSRSKLAEFVSIVNREHGASASAYFVFPNSSNSDIYPIKYLYTKDEDIKTLWGYDLGTSDNLSKTMLDTSVSGVEQLSPPLTLSRVITSSNRTGYVVMLPVYSDGGSLRLEPEQRRRFLVGFIGTFLKPEDLFLGFGGSTDKSIQIKVADGGKEMFRSFSGGNGGKAAVTREVVILGRVFQVGFHEDVSARAVSFLDRLPHLTLLVLIVINAFWYMTFAAMIIAQMREQRISREASEDLRKFKQVVDGVSDLVIITDNLGQIIYANDAISKATGFSLKEIIGKKPSLWGRQMERSFYEDFWRTVKVEKKPYWGELTNKRKSGELYEVELRVWPITDEKGEVVYYIGIERDITKTKAVENMKTEFISLASHQLRTPLSAVKWFGKMLLDGEAGDLSETQKEYLNKIYESNEREIQLVNSLLNVSRIESGRIKIEPKLTDVRKIVESVIADLKVGLNKSVRKIKFTSEKDMPEMMVDPDLLRHVFLNLITNSIRYTKENGSISVSMRVKDGQLETKIVDDGIGIIENEQGRIFEKFFRGSNALKKETDGSGLGLYLAKSVIESSGGKIWFKSRENMGTTFWFTLPLDKGR